MSAAFPKRAVGTTGASVSTLGLGGGALGGMYATVEEEEACRTVTAAYESGVRYFDTAPLYGHGLSERRLGRALSGLDRSQLAVSTKVGVRIDPQVAPDADGRYADPFLLEGAYDFSYDGCMRSFEGSLQRLGLERVEIVYIHDPDEGDSAVPASQRRGVNRLPEVMDGAHKALLSLREQGLIDAIGVGLNGTELLVEFAKTGGFDCFLLAGRYTLLEQDGLDDLFPICEERRISVIVGGVFNSGILATGAAPGAKYNYVDADPETIERVARIEELCERHGVRLSAAALQFPLANPVVAAVIPGARVPAESAANGADAAAPIPPALWSDLREHGLLDPATPLAEA